MLDKQPGKLEQGAPSVHVDGVAGLEITKSRARDALFLVRREFRLGIEDRFGHPAVDTHRSAVDPFDLAAFFQMLEIAADRGRRDRQRPAELVDADKPLATHHRPQPIPPFRRQFFMIVCDQQ